MSYSIFSKCGTTQSASTEYRAKPPPSWSYIPPRAIASSVSSRHPQRRPVVPRERVVPEQELQDHRRRELRRAAEAAPAVVEVAGERGHRDRQVHGTGRRVARRSQRARRERRRDPHAGRQDVLASLLPRLADRRGQQLREGRQPVARLRREVGAGVEGPALVVEEDGHRPAAVPGQADGGLHVDRVDVGPLLAVDLDADEALVHQCRDRLVLERLVRHDVAPVAGRVADRQEDRARRAAAPPRTPPPTTPTSPPGCRRAAGGTGWSTRSGGSARDHALRVAGISARPGIHRARMHLPATAGSTRLLGEHGDVSP